MSEEHPNKKLNGESDESSDSESSEEYRTNSSYNRSSNSNIRHPVVNTKLTFSNDSSNFCGTRSVTSGSICRCGVGPNESGASATRCSCRLNGAGLQSRSSLNERHSSCRNGFFQRSSTRLSERHHSMDSDIHNSTSFASPRSRKSDLSTGARAKERVPTSDLGLHFNGMPIQQVAPQRESTGNYFRTPFYCSVNSGKVDHGYGDALTQQEIDFIFENTQSNVSNHSELDDSIYSTGNIAKLANDTYDLNGLKLSRDELEFVLNQSSPTPNFEGLKHSSGSVKYSGTGANFINTSKRESGAGSLDFEDAKNAGNRQTKFRQHPVTSAEKLLASSSLELLEIPWAADEDLSKCPICLGSLQHDSPGQSTSHIARDLVGAAMLANCGHAFHCCCLLPLLTGASESFSCPLCRTIHGVVTGTQPPGGTMRTSVESFNLPGFPTANTIVISYELPEGVQGPGHPKPGQPYHLKGFPRKAYVPDTSQGRQVVALLKKAFDKRLVFTVGHSASLNLDDCVIWGSISHKTLKNGEKFGFPDPNYLDNVTLELAALGIREDL
ncbi:Zinc finger C3HC4 RING-type [Trinorchestia longiramus]|nr:Zinc finger C3HC4 RING-type [Trinorchestia longiramus]